MTVEALVPRVRKALGVSSSFDSEDIPDLIRAAIGRLLRDYHFPKTVSRYYLGSGGTADGSSGSLLALSDQSFDLPNGFKLAGQLRFYDPSEKTWSDPLERRDGFILPSELFADVTSLVPNFTNQITKRFWLEGTKLWIDLAIDTDGVGKQLVLWYESLLVDTASEAWMTTDFTDAVVYLSIMRGALQFRKPDVAKDYSGLWQDEQTSLAIYLNELEWDSVVVMQRERRVETSPRYPI